MEGIDVNWVFFSSFSQVWFFFYNHSFLTTNETDFGSQILIKYNQVLLYKDCMLDRVKFWHYRPSIFINMSKYMYVINALNNYTLVY